MFSRVNEIPDMATLIENVDLFDIMPILFKQKKVFWESNKLSNKYHYRAFALMYTHFIKTKNLYDSFLSLKTPIPVNRLTLDCGWELNGYQKKDDNVASLEFWQGKKIDLKNFIRLHKEQKDFDNNPLITEKSGLPKVFVKHQTQEKARKAKKIILTEDINLFENSSESILLVEKGKIRSNENFDYNFVIPSTQYYDSVDFGEAYSKNETLKVLSLLGFLPHDIITYYKKETLDKVSITYREFVESIPSELF